MKLFRQLSTVSAELYDELYILKSLSLLLYTHSGLVVEENIFARKRTYNLFQESMNAGIELPVIRSLSFGFNFAIEINKTSFFKTRHFYRTFPRTQI